MITRHIVIHEGFWKSIIQDTFTFLGVFTLILVNHLLLKENSSWIIDCMGLIVVLSVVAKLFKPKLKVDCRSLEELNEAFEEAKKVYDK